MPRRERRRNVPWPGGPEARVLFLAVLPRGEGLVPTAGRLPGSIAAREDGAGLGWRGRTSLGGGWLQPGGVGGWTPRSVSRSRAWIGHQELEWASVAQGNTPGMGSPERVWLFLLVMS